MDVEHAHLCIVDRFCIMVSFLTAFVPPPCTYMQLVRVYSCCQLVALHLNEGGDRPPMHCGWATVLSKCQDT